MNEGAQSQRSPWLDFRRKRFWAIVAIIVYTLAGFFLVPALVAHYGEKQIEEATGRDATIADVRFNPYLLKLEVDGFGFADEDGETLASFDHLVVDFQLSSLFRWALTFKTFQVDGPYLLYERFDATDSRLSRLLADVEARNPAQETESSEGGLPRLLVGTLAINDGRGLFRDHAQDETVEIPAGSIGFSWCQVPVIYTLDESAAPSVTIVRDNGDEESTSALELSPEDSAAIFRRSGRIRKLVITFGTNLLFAD